MRSSIVDITGLPKAQVLAALFNAAPAPIRWGVLEYKTGPLVMDEEWAQQLIDQEAGSLSFNYLHGRHMKVNLTGESFEAHAFDDEAGEGTAQKAIDHLRQTGAVVMTPDCDGRTWLRTVTDASLRRFDEEDPEAAYVNFLVGTARHPETAWIPDWEFTSLIVVGGLLTNRDEFEKAMIGFGV